MLRQLAAISALSFLLSSCAAMFHGTTSQVAIRTNVEGAELYVNEAYLGKNSGVFVFKKREDYTITARKKGCTDSSIAVSKSFDPTTLLGILIDLGLISILIIDGLVTGAWTDFDQTSYVIDPTCPN